MADGFAFAFEGIGHDEVCVGYDDIAHVFIVMNSYGTGWGDNGYEYWAYDRFLSVVKGCWAIVSIG